MSKLTGSAYGAAIRAFMECCNKDNGGDLDKLKGVVVDSSSAQINGINFALILVRKEEKNCCVVAR